MRLSGRMKGTTVKFMVSWSIDQDKWLPILDKWASMTPEERADAGEGVTIVGRWHDLNSRTGVAILEASPRLLPRLDPDAVAAIRGETERIGVAGMTSAAGTRSRAGSKPFRFDNMKRAVFLMRRYASATRLKISSDTVISPR